MRCTGWMGVAAALWLGAAAAAGAAEVPLPPGVQQLQAPHHVDLGRTSMKVQAFISRLGTEALIAFYQQELPKAGWRVEALPWQAQHTEATERLKKTVTYHRDKPEGPELEQQLSDFEQTAKGMRGEIYASQGEEHVIVNLWPGRDAAGSTMVFINRWTGDRRWMERKQPAGGPGLPAAGSAAGSSWPATNVCCSGEEVPGLTAGLPFAVPRYPGARAVAKSAPASGASATVLLMTPDSGEAVAGYYRKQMPLNGWTLAQASQDSSTDSGDTQVLTFEKPDRRCELTIADEPASAGSGKAPQTTVTVSIVSKSFGGSSTEGAP